MSISLDGTILKSEESLKWTGDWRFSKEKSQISFQFEHKWISEKIPRDFFDYVSFTTGNNIEVDIKKSKTKNRSRSRVRHSTNKSKLNISPNFENTSNLLGLNETHTIPQPELEPDEILNDQIDESGLIQDISSLHSEDVVIDRIHPLFGLWEGSFSLKDNQRKFN